MKTTRLILLCVLATVPGAVLRAADEVLDRLDEALTWSGWADQVRARLSGSVDLGLYHFQQPAPALLGSGGHTLFAPRLVLLLDAQLGSRFYAFAQFRADRGFDPGNYGGRRQFDEYAVRYSPRSDGAFNLQVGKFATVVGNWVPRHLSWDNPFVTAPLPYENPVGLFDSAAASSINNLLFWAKLRPSPDGSYRTVDLHRVPVIWGPSYTSGAAVTGTTGRVDYALELKNASLSSRPSVWDAARTQWQHPTVSGRLGWRPDERWNLGVSFSTGSYLQPSAAPTLAPGRSLSAYRQIVLAQDVSFAWHHWQVWAECFATRFAIPRVGNADTLAYYLEAKYKFTPQFFGAVRWNQQFFGTVPDALGNPVRWGRATWRVDLAPTYRFTPHTLLKLQYSLEHGRPAGRRLAETLALEFVLRF